MTIVPLDLAANATPEALHAFLTHCQAVAVRAGRTQLVSISLEVDALDPLAVLESIFEPGEPHFYAERPDIETAVSGAEVAFEFETHGPDRFAAVLKTRRDWAEAKGLSGDIVESLYRDLVAYCVSEEHKQWQTDHASAGRESA